MELYDSNIFHNLKGVFMEKYVANKDANKQINKIKELVVLGYSDIEIAYKLESRLSKN